jgi:hypothetical protein
MRIDPLRGAGPILTLEQAIDRDCRESRGGLTAVCAILGEPYDGFQKRLSVSYPEHHLYMQDFERVVELVRGAAVRQWFERMYGVVCYQPAPVPATQDALLALGRMMATEAGFVSSLAEGVADSRWERGEVELLEQHGMALVAQLLAIMAGARQAMEEPSHG